MRRVYPAVLLATVCLATSGEAAVKLLATGTVVGRTDVPGSSSTSDLSGLTNTLENGLPANILGGIGSAVAYAGGNTFLFAPDRGPNATSYAASVDDTVSYIARFQTVTLDLAANASGAALPFALTPTLTSTTLLSSPTPLNYGSGAGLATDKGAPIGSGAPAQNSAGAYYFTGRSDNYGPGNSGNPADARLDPEGIRVSNDGRSVFVSDEYGPYVRQFDRATGKLVQTYTLPTNLDVANLSPNGATEMITTGPNGNTSGRVANKGMEGLAITPDGKTLVGIMQAPLIQDAADPATGKLLRIVTIDIATGTTHEYGYTLTNGSGVSEIVAINDHQFLVDERDGKGLGDGSNAKYKQLFQIDITGATDITNLTGAAAAAAAIPKAGPKLDIVSVLAANGYATNQIPAKIEGLAFGQDVTLNGTLYHTLIVGVDNDFVPQTAGGNQVFAFGFTDADLPGFQAQAFGAVQEPASWALMIGGFGLVGGALRRRRVAVRFA